MTTESKMFFLISWKNNKSKSKTFSIVSEDRIRTIKGKVEAKWRNNYYPAKILQKSEDKKWLESLEVLTDGTVNIRDYPKNYKSTVADEKQKILNMAKENKKQKTVVEKNLEKEIVEEPSIFEAHEQSITDMHTPLMTPTDELEKSVDNSSIPKVTSNINEILALPSKSTVTLENIQFLSGLLSMATETYKAQTGHEVAIVSEQSSSSLQVVEETSKNRIFGSYRLPGKGKVEIFPQCNIWIDGIELDFIKTQFRKNPKEMARKLMKNLLGENNLKDMSPTGRGGHTAIPKQIVDIVEKFVRDNTKPSHKINHQDYMRTLTLMCNTIRYLEKERNKQKMKNDSNKVEEFESKETEEFDDQALLGDEMEKQKNKKRKNSRSNEKESLFEIEDENSAKIDIKKRKNKKLKMLGQEKEILIDEVQNQGSDEQSLLEVKIARKKSKNHKKILVVSSSEDESLIDKENENSEKEDSKIKRKSKKLKKQEQEKLSPMTFEDHNEKSCERSLLDFESRRQKNKKHNKNLIFSSEDESSEEDDLKKKKKSTKLKKQKQEPPPLTIGEQIEEPYEQPILAMESGKQKKKKHRKNLIVSSEDESSINKEKKDSVKDESKINKKSAKAKKQEQEELSPLVENQDEKSYDKLLLEIENGKRKEKKNKRNLIVSSEDENLTEKKNGNSGKDDTKIKKKSKKLKKKDQEELPPLTLEDQNENPYDQTLLEKENGDQKTKKHKKNLIVSNEDESLIDKETKHSGKDDSKKNKESKKAKKQKQEELLPLAFEDRSEKSERQPLLETLNEKQKNEKQKKILDSENEILKNMESDKFQEADNKGKNNKKLRNQEKKIQSMTYKLRNKV